MLSQHLTTITATNSLHNVVDRVLHLRRQLGIATPLSVSDSEDMHLSPGEIQESAMATLRYASPAQDGRDWLVWSQSPSEGNQPKKDYGERLRCR